MVGEEAISDSIIHLESIACLRTAADFDNLIEDHTLATPMYTFAHP
jgi:hypothetical protein